MSISRSSSRIRTRTSNRADIRIIIVTRNRSSARSSSSGGSSGSRGSGSCGNSASSSSRST